MLEDLDEISRSKQLSIVRAPYKKLAPPSKHDASAVLEGHLHEISRKASNFRSVRDYIALQRGWWTTIYWLTFFLARQFRLSKLQRSCRWNTARLRTELRWSEVYRRLVDCRNIIFLTCDNHDSIAHEIDISFASRQCQNRFNPPNVNMSHIRFRSDFSEIELSKVEAFCMVHV